MKLALFPKIFSLIIVSAAIGGAKAQDAPDLPPGPLLARAPDFSSWTVTIDRPPRNSSATKVDKDKNPPSRIVVLKTKPIICEQRFQPAIKSATTWFRGDLQISMDSGDKYPTVAPATGSGDIYSADYTKTDFAGLDWISTNTFSGIRKFKGQECLVFQSEISTLSVLEQRDEGAAAEAARIAALYAKQSGSKEAIPFSPTPKAPCTAVIDLKTRLPIVATFGKETRSYTFGPPPTQMLQMPDGFQSALDAYSARLKRLSSQP